MTHISKFKMKDRVKQRISANLANALLESGVAQGRAMLDTLLTPTERIMLAKRLAIIVMLEREYSYYRIMKTLKVSTSTIKRLHRNLETGQYRFVQRALGKKSSSLTFLELLEVFLAAGMPSIAGPRHQKRLNELRHRMRHG